MTTVLPVLPPRHRAPSSLRTVLPAALAAAVVAGAAALGAGALVAAVVVVQVCSAAGVLLLADVPARRRSALLATVAAVAADTLAVRDNGERVGDLVVVVSLSLIAAVLLELLRRDRVRVTESLAATMTAVVLVVLTAHLLTLRESAGGSRVVVLALGALAVGLLAGGVAELVVRGPAVASGSRRGVLGIVTAVAAAGALGAAVGGSIGSLSRGTAAALALSTAVAGATGGLVVELACSDTTPARRRAAAGPLGASLPIALAAPVAYAVSRLVVG